MIGCCLGCIIKKNCCEFKSGPDQIKSCKNFTITKNMSQIWHKQFESTFKSIIILARLTERLGMICFWFCFPFTSYFFIAIYHYYDLENFSKLSILKILFRLYERRDGTLASECVFVNDALVCVKLSYKLD